MSIICLWTHPNPKDRLSWSFRFGWAVLPVCFGLIFYRCFTRICKNVLLARMGSTFLKSGPQHFTSKKPFFGPPSGKKMRHFGHFRLPWILKSGRKNEYNLLMSPNKPEGPPTKCIIPAIGSLRSHFLWFLMIVWRSFLDYSAIFFDS